jgi:DNA-directed RNA polymerase subunit M/transcription elongation factor TFIIS
MIKILTCRECGGRLVEKSNQTGKWYECEKCGRIWDPGQVVEVK